jgi:hypothetical protein
MAHPKVQATPETVRAAFEKIASAIGLRDQDCEVMLGSPESQLDRMGMLLAVFELAEDLIGDACAWLNAPNKGDLFGGKPPIAFILEDPRKNLHSILQYLRGAYGGWA